MGDIGRYEFELLGNILATEVGDNDFWCGYLWAGEVLYITENR